MRTEDAERLAILWTESQRDVAAFLRSTVDPQHVPDLLQQVAVKLVRSFDRYDAQRPFLPWAIGVAKNELLAWRRERAGDRHRFGDELIEQLAEAFTRSSMTRQPLYDALEDCLEKIDGRGRRALEMYYGQGQRGAEVAAAMSMSVGAVRMLLCRVREAVRQCIQRRIAAHEVP